MFVQLKNFTKKRAKAPIRNRAVASNKSRQVERKKPIAMGIHVILKHYTVFPLARSNRKFQNVLFLRCVTSNFGGKARSQFLLNVKVIVGDLKNLHGEY